MNRFRKVANADRYAVIREDDFSVGNKKLPTPAPAAIRLVEAEGCPANYRRACVYIDTRNTTSVCRYLGPYPDQGGEQRDPARVPCEHPEVNGPLPVRLLVTFVDCEIKQGLCIGPAGTCDALKDVSPALTDNGSPPHYHVVCERLEEETRRSVH